MYDDEGYPDGMEYEEEPEDDEDNVSEDEDNQGMGPVEGMPGDHGVDLEVILEDGDDSESSDDDDEHDSDDDDDDEGDDAHLEIIDDAGNVQELGEDEMQWESDDGRDDDDGEEEDYEGQAQDQDEAEIHDMDMVGGPLGDLVRALGGGNDALDLVEQMQEQMEAGGIDRDEGEDDEHVTGEYAEEDEGKF